VDSINKFEMKLQRRILRIIFGESGATFLEYAMLCALIGIVVSISVAALGKSLKTLFGNISGKVSDVNNGINGNNP